jgi:uncharacterized membrane protein
MPPIPAWDAAHPLIVHIPIGLLLFTPVLMLLSIVAPKGWKPLAVASLVTLVFGLIGAVLALMSGEAGESAAEVNRAAYATLENHEELAELTRNIFIGLTAAYAAVVGLALGLKKFGRRGYVIASLILLAPYAFGALTLARTAHQGGLLVHHFGVRAPLPAPPASPAPTEHDD